MIKTKVVGIAFETDEKYYESKKREGGNREGKQSGPGPASHIRNSSMAPPSVRCSLDIYNPTYP